MNVLQKALVLLVQSLRITIIYLYKIRFLYHCLITVTNINDIREEIKRRINMGNACYYSFEKILSSRLLES